MCKGIIDFLAKNIWDLKTTGWQTPAEFTNNIVNYGYDSQSALYRELVAVETGVYLPCKWLVITMREPIQVWVQEPTAYHMACGLRRVNEILTFIERERDEN